MRQFWLSIGLLLASPIPVFASQEGRTPQSSQLTIFSLLGIGISSLMLCIYLVRKIIHQKLLDSVAIVVLGVIAKVCIMASVSYVLSQTQISINQPGMLFLIFFILPYPLFMLIDYILIKLSNKKTNFQSTVITAVSINSLMLGAVLLSYFAAAALYESTSK